MRQANWWSGESFAALTDARHSGQHASSSNLNTLESECCKRLAATSYSSDCCKEGEPEDVLRPVAKAIRSEGEPEKRQCGDNKADGAHKCECLCPLMEGTPPDVGPYQHLCRQCAQNIAVVRCCHCGRFICDDCAKNDYVIGGVVCLRPCLSYTNMDTPSNIPGSSGSEPVTTDGRSVNRYVALVMEDYVPDETGVKGPAEKSQSFAKAMRI